MSPIDSTLTICLTLLGLGIVAWYLGRVQTEARWARRRLPGAGTSARLAQLEQRVTAERLRVAEEAAKRKALDQFLSELHAEERAYVRQRDLGANRKRSVVVEERLYFRNLPISNWTEQELTFYTSSDAPNRPEMLPRGAV